MSSAPGFSFDEWMSKRKAAIDEVLRRRIADLQQRIPEPLGKAMAYSLLGEGKRIRPCLVAAAAEAVGRSLDGPVLDFACAVEEVHAYSLIHDDLPSMDDDDFRRGRPTCHRVFGDAIAILAGDALLTEAFRSLAAGGTALHARLCMRLGEGAGAEGMVGGQADDIQGNWPPELSYVERVHARKTGALIEVCCVGGGEAADADERQIRALREFGRRVGLAFQIVDDLLDFEKTDSSSDKEDGKPTFPALLGIGAARLRAVEEISLAKEALECTLPGAQALMALADFAQTRGR